MNGKVLLHISDRDKWPVALSLIKSAADQSRWEIVIIADIFAAGICVSCNKVMSEQMQALVADGHEILVCGDSLRALKIPTGNLPEFMTVIANSLAEVLKRRAEGWQYVKL